MATSMRWIALFLLVAVSALAVSAIIEDGLLPNGDFRNGPDKSQMKGPVLTGKHAIPNWELSGFVEYIESGHTQADMMLPVPVGANAVRLGNDATIRQQLKVARHTYYSISFIAARSCAQEEKLNVSVDPEFGLLPIQTVYTNTGWDTYSWAFKPRHTTVWLSIHNTGIEENPACGPLIIAVAIKTLYPQLYNKGNMVKNGDFEQGPYIFPNTPWGVLMPPIFEDVHSPLPWWMIMSDTKVVKYIDAQHHAVPKGARAVELVAGVEVALVQEVLGTVPGRSYRLTFSVGDARNGCVGSLGVDVYAARERLRVSYVSRGTGGHKCGKLEFTAIADKTRVVFQSSNHHTVNATLCGPVVDDVWLVRLK
ncbi:hypothetical protein CFC21_017877 [Triticum aestivum]|uniref:DUF642 domain-containing protein n=3 Tax=Triticum TaxID=4564 RepID=A0A9R1NZ69_TRITD|nr:uncharacterized protein LOC123185658 [Triticum aestivum]KAF7002378.1 hypothetical protein CFC21_017877 [Triticum aestivum]VAH33738.1 unnamed protein product [Triticum turgidum subsp. durum]